MRLSQSNRLLAAGVALSLSASGALAAPLTVDNFSFESPAIADGTATGTPPDSWGNGLTPSSSGSGAFNPQNDNFTGSTGDPGTTSIPGGQGHQVIYVNEGNPASSGMQQFAFQNLADTVAANTTYTLTVAIGNSAALIDETFAIRLLATSPSASTVIAEAIGNANTYAPQGTFLDISAFSTVAITDALVGQGLQIQLVNTNSVDTVDSTGIQVTFDNVRLDASPIPEPASLGLLGLGAIGLLARRRGAGNATA